MSLAPVRVKTMGVMFAILGLIILGVAYLMHWRAQQAGKGARLWPTTPGTVVSAAVAPVATLGGAMLGPVISYSYTVSGQALTCSRLRVGVDPRFNTPAKVQALVDKYRAGSAVTVHYDPANPTMAALDLTVGESYGPLYVGAFGATLLFLGLVTAFLGV